MPSVKVHKDYTVTPIASNFKTSQNPLSLELPADGCTIIFDNPPGGGNGQKEFDYQAGTNSASIQFVAGEYVYCVQAYQALPKCVPAKNNESNGNTIQVSDSRLK